MNKLVLILIGPLFVSVTFMDESFITVVASIGLYGFFCQIKDVLLFHKNLFKVLPIDISAGTLIFADKHLASSWLKLIFILRTISPRIQLEKV